jgi:hypothetical protein
MPLLSIVLLDPGPQTTVIPTGVLRGISKVREVGHRTQPFRIGFQLGEPFTDLVNDLLQRGTG